MGGKLVNTNPADWIFSFILVSRKSPRSSFQWQIKKETDNIRNISGLTKWVEKVAGKMINCYYCYDLVVTYLIRLVCFTKPRHPFPKFSVHVLNQLNIKIKHEFASLTPALSSHHFLQLINSQVSCWQVTKVLIFCRCTSPWGIIWNQFNSYTDTLGNVEYLRWNYLSILGRYFCFLHTITFSYISRSCHLQHNLTDT